MVEGPSLGSLTLIGPRCFPDPWGRLAATWSPRLGEQVVAAARNGGTLSRAVRKGVCDPLRRVRYAFPPFLASVLEGSP